MNPVDYDMAYVVCMAEALRNNPALDNLSDFNRLFAEADERFDTNFPGGDREVTISRAQAMVIASDLKLAQPI